jgi:hypothetical protein
MNYAEDIRAKTQASRHDYAHMLFNIQRIQDFIKNKASDGHCQLRIFQSHPHELKDEIATQALLQWLDENGFHYSWEETFIQADKLRPRTYGRYHELVINW